MVPSTTFSMGSKPWVTRDDAIAAFNLFCAVCGIGTLGMPANFARAGPYLGILAMVFMGFANVYASVVCSKAMLIAPRSVKTFGDLGEWSMGKFGRYAVVVSQMGVCLLAPTAFLVLGGNLLDALFPSAFSRTFWIILMALMVLPVCLTPTLKEGAGAAFAGCLGTIVADVVGVGMLIHGMSGHPAVPAPNVTFEQVISTFGNLALAYGAAVVIPSLQREHGEPTRMPMVICITMTIITLLFIALAWTGYSAVGCQISGNLLFSIFPDPVTKLSSLGMKADFGAAVIAYLGMQLHITIAFAVLLYPAFFISERLVLGMHASKFAIEPESLPYHASDTPQSEDLKRTSSTGDGNQARQSKALEHNDAHDDGSAEYRGAGVMVKYIILRVVIVALLVLAAVLLQDKFIDLADFVGASANTTCCIILPILFYIKKMGKRIGFVERAIGLFVVITCTVLGAYVTYSTGSSIFSPAAADPNAPKFPFCKAENQNELYYTKP